MDESYSENLSNININLEDNKTSNKFVKNEPGFIRNMKDHKEEIILGMMMNKNNNNGEQVEEGNRNKPLAAHYTEEISSSILGSLNTKLE
jgi:hypothetical protein